uniref:Uncharacterized protein n=1 Tax=Romanomermis culicivorax TaxID=13658 RepID=A0A915I5V7_ROMCU
MSRKCINLSKPFCTIGCPKRFHFRDEDTRLIDTERVAGMINSTNDAQTERTVAFGQFYFLQKRANMSVILLGKKVKLDIYQLS